VSHIVPHDVLGVKQRPHVQLPEISLSMVGFLVVVNEGENVLMVDGDVLHVAEVIVEQSHSTLRALFVLPRTSETIAKISFHFVMKVNHQEMDQERFVGFFFTRTTLNWTRISRDLIFDLRLSKLNWKKLLHNFMLCSNMKDKLMLGNDDNITEWAPGVLAPHTKPSHLLLDLQPVVFDRVVGQQLIVTTGVKILGTDEASQQLLRVIPTTRCSVDNKLSRFDLFDVNPEFLDPIRIITECFAFPCPQAVSFHVTEEDVGMATEVFKQTVLVRTPAVKDWFEADEAFGEVLLGVLHDPVQVVAGVVVHLQTLGCGETAET